jgi:polyhydroxyalkanoate synthesis regulator phasin
MLDGRVKRRLRRHRLSEEANNIEWETRREVKLLRTEVERLKSQLEARCAEIQSIRDMEDLGGQEGSGNPIVELTARVQELELQVAGLKAELHQKEVESGIEVADLFEDDVRVITNGNLQETHVHDDTINSPTRLDTSFPSPPPTMPNTPVPTFVHRKCSSSILNPQHRFPERGPKYSASVRVGIERNWARQLHTKDRSVIYRQTEKGETGYGNSYRWSQGA